MLFILLACVVARIGVETTDVPFERSVMDQVNAVRGEGCICEGRSMPPVARVSWHPTLELSAKIHARQMARDGFFEHYSAGGLDIGERANRLGYPWRVIGENLARGQSDIPGVIEAWIKSPEHCKVLMNPKFREMGAAHIGDYWVLHMGVRKP